MKTIAISLKQAYERLEKAGVPDSLLDAQYLLAELTNTSRLELVLSGQSEVPEAVQAAYEALIQRREKREPLQYILGFTPFAGLILKTDARALIPRPETELLVEKALEFLPKDAKVLDVCTGTGAIGLAIKKHAPGATVTLADLSPDALALAKENAEALGLEVTLVKGDLFAPVSGQRFDIITANPPYIQKKACGELDLEVQKEPLMALDGGVDGLDFYRRIAKEAPSDLLLLEIGFDQGESVPDLLKPHFTDVKVFKDYGGCDRIVLAKR
jgi:protein-(glutamine-N5) methyltransferase, release factor-specific